ncbi:DotA/TraY family protein [Ralstonia pseudosolanacearum]
MGKILLSILALLMPGLAMAAAGGPFDPPDSDVSMKVLNALFGNLGIFGAGGSDALGNVMQIFNGAVLIVGGILATYTLLAGTLGTAHDGEMLGRKFSSVWIPIRYSLGTALVLPVINGQYAVINYIVGWLLVQGAGLADNIWTKYMSSSNIQAQMQVGITEPSATALGWNAFSSLVCMRGFEYITKDGKNGGTVDPIVVPGGALTAGITIDGGVNNTVYQFGFPNGGAGFSPTTCGTMTVKAWEWPTNAKTDVGGLTLLGNTQFAIDSAKKIADQNNQAAKELVNKLDTVAKAWVANPSTDPGASIAAAVAAYQATIKGNAAALVSAYSNLNELQESAKRDGWAFAGAFYMKVSYLMDLTGRTTASIPEATGMKLDTGTFSQAFVAAYADPLKKIQASNDSAGHFAINSVQGGSADEFGVWKWIKSGFDSTMAIKHIFAISTNFVLNDGSNPVLEMKRLGQWTLGAAGGITMGYVSILTGLSEVPSQGTTATTIAIALLPIMLTVMPLLFAAGFTLTYVVPMMPFLMWVGVFLGWLIMAVEAVIISSMWAVMHLHPNGDDLTGKGANGYSLVLSLMLRPAFSVMGLIASINIIYVFGQLINKIFADVFLLSQTDAGIFVWIFGVLAAPLIYCGMMWMVIRKCFSATTTIADELLKWFGGQGASLGRTAEELGGNGAGTYAAAFTAARTAGGLAGGAKDGRNMVDSFRGQSAQREMRFQKDREEMNKLGEGIADKKNSALGIKDAKDSHSFKNQEAGAAYNSGIIQAEKFGGEEGAEQFADMMLEASENKFAEYGGSAATAAEAISRDISSQAVTNSVQEQFGEAGLNYMNSIASSNGSLNVNKAAKAAADLGKAKAALGSNFDAVVSSAVENHAGDSKAMSGYIAAHYNTAKQQQITPDAVATEDAFHVADTPVFNPATGEVEGGAVTQPQQPTQDQPSEGFTSGQQPPDQMKDTGI